RRGLSGAWQQNPGASSRHRNSCADGDSCVFRRSPWTGNSRVFPFSEAPMTDQTPPVDEMHYEQLAQDALRGVIRLALERAAEPEGIPGAHHFYITFKTRGAGVSVPPDVLAQYPDEMTVDRKSTRLNSSHVKISYAVFCL